MIPPEARQRISDFQLHVNTAAADIRHEVAAAWQTIDLTQSEPNIVYSFLSSTTGGLGHLNRTLAPILGSDGRTVKFAGIFLHQKPMVSGFTSSGGGYEPSRNTCELGDLQVLFLYVSSDKTVCQCRSTIFQAKKTPSTGPYVIQHADQRRLYDKCSGFAYTSVLVGEQRWLPFGKPERERALQYLFVGHLPVRARLVPSNNGRGAFLDFGEFILRLLNDSTGLNVTAAPSKGHNWSRIVWDQIDNVASSAFGHNGPRSAGLRALLDRFNSFEDPKEFFLEVPPTNPKEPKPDHAAPGGIPVLLIITSDKGINSEDLLHFHE